MTNINEELKKIQVADDVDRIELFGNMDANLNLIQESTGVEIFQRDDCLLIRGGEMELAEGILEELMSALRTGEHLDVQKVAYIISMNGKLHKILTLPEGETVTSMPQGVYIVRVGGQSYKLRF